MNLLQRLRFLVQTALSDLFSEEAIPGRPIAPVAGAGSPLEGRLAQAQASLDTLRLELAQAEARQRQAELEWQAAQAELETLDAGVDAALERGEEAQARQRQQTLQRSQPRLLELERRSREYAQTAAELRAELETLQAGLDDARFKARRLAEQERRAAGLEQTAQLRHELSRQLEHLADDIRQGEEQAARRADRAAALRELEHKR